MNLSTSRFLSDSVLYNTIVSSSVLELTAWEIISPPVTILLRMVGSLRAKDTRTNGVPSATILKLLTKLAKASANTSWKKVIRPKHAEQMLINLIELEALGSCTRFDGLYKGKPEN